MSNPAPTTNPRSSTAAPAREATTSPVEVSLIITCYNGADTLGEQLDSLAAQTWAGEWEVIMADNGSTDDSVAVATQYQDVLPLKIIDAGQKKGQSYAYNRAVEASSGSLLLFCDADDVMHPEYVEAMVDALREHPYVGGHERHDKVNAEWLQARAQTNNKDGGLIRSCHRPFVAGCTIGVQRWAYDEVGGFDESLIRLKDMDFGWRLAEIGVHPRYVPEAQFYYRSRPTLKGNVKQEYNVARWFFHVHRLHGHECHVKGRPLRFLWNEAKALIRQGLKMRSWGDILLWVRRVAWVWGLALEARHDTTSGVPSTSRT